MTVTNTGKRAGDEVVQLYVRDPVASVTRPVLELASFVRLTLAPGESRMVTFETPVGQLGCPTDVVLVVGVAPVDDGVALGQVFGDIADDPVDQTRRAWRVPPPARVTVALSGPSSTRSAAVR